MKRSEVLKGPELVFRGFKRSTPIEEDLILRAPPPLHFYTIDPLCSHRAFVDQS
jgi:hypothetical protein